MLSTALACAAPSTLLRTRLTGCGSPERSMAGASGGERYSRWEMRLKQKIEQARQLLPTSPFPTKSETPSSPPALTPALPVIGATLLCSARQLPMPPSAETRKLPKSTWPRSSRWCSCIDCARCRKSHLPENRNSRHRGTNCRPRIRTRGCGAETEPSGPS